MEGWFANFQDVFVVVFGPILMWAALILVVSAVIISAVRIVYQSL